MRLASIVSRQLARRGERIVYRVAGLPITLAALLATAGGTPPTLLRSAYARHYWAPESGVEWFDLGTALCIWPVALIAAALWFTCANGPTISRRCGKPMIAQFVEQLRLFFTAGILPPWYYIFALHDRGAGRDARSFLNRCETKEGVYRVLAARHGPTSPLRDKAAFAAHCRQHGLAIVPILAIASAGRLERIALPEPALPRIDLFVKPVIGRGGGGAERWDHVGDGLYHNELHGTLGSAALLDRLIGESHDTPRIIQPRLRNDDRIADLSNGALATIRALTCLDEQDRPELVGAVLRMAIGANHTVDNLHAGGIAAGIDLATGALSRASDLGMSARIGWLDRHPQTGATIGGRIFPQWDEVRHFAEQAHRAFADRAYVGWDIALTDRGLVLVEGNHAPDVDIMQRACGRGIADQRYGELLAFHLARPPGARNGAEPHGPSATRCVA